MSKLLSGFEVGLDVPGTKKIGVILVGHFLIFKLVCEGRDFREKAVNEYYYLIFFTSAIFIIEGFLILICGLNFFFTNLLHNFC